MAENVTVIEIWESEDRKVSSLEIEGSGSIWMVGAKGGAGPYEVTQPQDDLLKIVLGTGLALKKAQRTPRAKTTQLKQPSKTSNSVKKPAKKVVKKSVARKS